MAVAGHYELDSRAAGEIIAEVGRAVATWRTAAVRLGLTRPEIDRMASAFEHEDLRASTTMSRKTSTTTKMNTKMKTKTKT
jgi:serine/threonine-protein kinase HipA